MPEDPSAPPSFLCLTSSKNSAMELARLLTLTTKTSAVFTTKDTGVKSLTGS